ncbi:hypothetical protein B0H17DRAFT_1149771 [Mycena rosella]|uniref:Uncharacterized protein n=1 Tax=Mycena rosella TaxID=1033263 RepID=A0AAD7BYI7_MYCRO|nr:hypothetical protein B0H17DRAFT_1149771 [Mycena rosella]
MTENFDGRLVGATSYNPAARGWTKALIRANHKVEIINLLTEQRSKCVAVVIVASDFLDRARGPGAIKATLIARKIPDTDKIDVYPPTPSVPVPAGKRPGMPWTNNVTDCSPAFKEAVMADPVFHNVYQDLPVAPETPWIVATYDGLSDLTTPAEFKAAMLHKLRADPVVTQMVSDDHSNMPGEHSIQAIISTILHFFNRPHLHGSMPRRTLLRRLQHHLMSPDFTVAVPKRGVATPWLGSNPLNPAVMSCSECHGVDHYQEDCPIVNSNGYRAVHGILDDAQTTDSSLVPTSLASTPAPPVLRRLGIRSFPRRWPWLFPGRAGTSVVQVAATALGGIAVVSDLTSKY